MIELKIRMHLVGALPLVLASPFKGRWPGGAGSERCRRQCGFALGFRFLQLPAADLSVSFADSSP